jgi:predicted nucleic acid-binding protein
MIKRVLLDAGPWFAVLSSRDEHHEWANTVFHQFTQFVTCEAVVTEVCHRLAYRGQSQNLALQYLDGGCIVVDFSLANSLPYVRSFLVKYADQQIDFADACLLAMVEEEPRCKLITTDRLFARARRSDRTVIPAMLPPAVG